MTEPVNSRKQAVEEAVTVSSHETGQEPGMTNCLCWVNRRSRRWYRHLQDL